MFTKLLGIKRPHVLTFAQDDRGSAYSISVVMMIPVMITFIAVAIELALLFISQQSLNTASSTSIHVSQVWLGHQDALQKDGSDLQKMVHRGVVRSMVPFTSAKVDPQAAKAGTMETVVKELGLSPVAVKRLEAKQAAIASLTRVTTTPERRSTDGWNVRIEYDVPLWMPVVGNLLKNSSTKDGRPARTLVSEVWLPLAKADVNRTGIGIPYSPHRSVAWPK